MYRHIYIYIYIDSLIETMHGNTYQYTCTETGIEPITDREILILLYHKCIHTYIFCIDIGVEPIAHLYLYFYIYYQEPSNIYDAAFLIVTLKHIIVCLSCM